MGTRAKTGTCAICGRYGDLTFEHIPQRSCYNNRSVEILRGMKTMDLNGDVQHRGQIQQRGAGDYHSCRSCNNATSLEGVWEKRRPLRNTWWFAVGS